MRPARLGVTACLLLAACGGGSGAPDGALLVVTTVSPITNIVATVGGEEVFVTGIVPEGVNSHQFEPNVGDARALLEADVVFMNGLHLEEPTRELAEANVGDGVKIVRLADATIGADEHIYDFSFPRSGGDPNPHLWTNLPYAKRYAEIVRDTLAGLRPAATAVFDANLAAFTERLDELDRLARRVTGTVPAANRKLLTYHDSFPYFAREYGWTVIGAVQPSDFSEPTPREVVDLIDQVRASGVPAIFGSEVFPSTVLERIARETGVRYIDDLRDDDLPGEPGDEAHSYLGLMVFDFRTFMGALGGDVSALDSFDVSNLVPETNTRYPQR